MIEEQGLVPHSDEAEQSLIGAALCAPGVVDMVGDLLRAEHFYREDHRAVWAHITAIEHRGQAVDVLTVFDSLQCAGIAERVGGLPYLGDMALKTPGSANARRYAEIIRDRALLRGLAAAGQQLIGMATAADGVSVMDKVAAADSMVGALTESSVDVGPVQIGSVLNESLAAMERQIDGVVRRMTTSLADLDHKVFDLQAGAMVVIAGRPGMGKTSLMLQMARHISESYGPVLVASMEMSRGQIGDRLLSMASGVPITRLAERDKTDDEWSQISAATGRIHELPLHIDDKGGQSVSEIRAKAQQIRRRAGGKMGGVFIDYLQLMYSEGDNQNERISNITRGLCAMAKTLNCPVVVLSQLNRKVEERPNKRPFMSDLRDSGAIEQDASLILFPYRDEYYNKDSDDAGTAEIEIAKQRNGPTGTVRVGWNGGCATFTNLDFAEWAASKPMRHEQKPTTNRKGFR